MELFRDNYNLLKNIADDQVLFFIFRLRNTGRKSSYIKFLSILCRCGDEPLMKNQNFICERLIVENHDLLISIKVTPHTHAHTTHTTHTTHSSLYPIANGR